jgi:hypothetical protein
MTQDEIMEMARQAHFDSKTWVDIFADNPTVGDVRNYHIAFAKLVAAKEREDIIQIIKETPFSNWFQGDVIEAIRVRGEQA